MDELFKEIITGKKELKELDNSHSNMSKKVQNTNEVAKYFLKTSKKKYNDDQLKQKDLKKLLEVYNDLIKNNKTIKKYINSNDEEKDLLKDAEHVIKLFVEDFTKSKANTSIWNKDIPVAGFVEPLLLGMITLLMSLIALGNLYLMI